MEPSRPVRVFGVVGSSNFTLAEHTTFLAPNSSLTHLHNPNNLEIAFSMLQTDEGAQHEYGTKKIWKLPEPEYLPFSIEEVEQMECVAMRRAITGDVDFNILTMPVGGGRKIAPFLKELDHCVMCAKKEGLRLCGKCALVIYCSRECQRINWSCHKMVCRPTQRIDLKQFYPLIAYMFDLIRHRRLATPGEEPHPGFRHRIVRVPAVGARRSSVDGPLHHTVFLGAAYNRDVAEEDVILLWQFTTLSFENVVKLTHHFRRETVDPCEATISVALTLLSEMFSTYYVRPSQDEPWENIPCFRLEVGSSPIVDFGICRGRIEGITSRVQTWTYFEPRKNKRTTFLDPDKHFWLYFRTIKGEEFTLDCCSYSLGMHGCIDASPLIKGFPEFFTISGFSRIPAYLHTPQDNGRHPYALVEEGRFSVMHNEKLRQDYSWLPLPSVGQLALIDFISTLQGKPCEPEQYMRVCSYRKWASLLINHVLLGNLWKDWGKPIVCNRAEDDTESTHLNQLLLQYRADRRESPPVNGITKLLLDETGPLGRRSLLDTLLKRNPVVSSKPPW